MSEKKIQDVVLLIREEIEKRVAVKPSWGKNELMLVINQAIGDAVAKLYDNQ